MRVITGAFHDEDKASEAIQELVDAGVPMDGISVAVTEPGGQHQVRVARTTPTLKGALLGGAIGAMLGTVVAALLATGVIAFPGLELGASSVFLTVLQGAAGGAGLGFAVGVLASLTPLLWREEADLDEEDLARETALVSVHSDELHDTAREVLERMGADQVE